MLRKIALFSALFNFMLLSAQKFISDTIHIQFNTDSIISSNYYIDTIRDNRNLSNTTISFTQKKKYLILPVDQEICLDKPLAVYLSQSSNHSKKDTLALDMDYFIVDRYQGWIFKQYRLKADFPVYSIKNDSSIFKGTISYTFEYQPKDKKATQEKAIEELLPKWHQQFKIDLLSTNLYLHSGNNKPEAFLDYKFDKPYFLHTTIGGVLGINFWQVEGELYLTRPETTKSTWFLSNIVRYQKTNNFETFSYGRKSEHYSRRISENWNFNVASNLLLGIVKYSNTEDIKLYQLFQASISSIQSIDLNKKNLSGFIFKAGLYENFYYIVEKTPGFQVGIYLSTGYKF